MSSSEETGSSSSSDEYDSTSSSSSDEILNSTENIRHLIRERDQWDINMQPRLDTIKGKIVHLFQ